MTKYQEALKNIGDINLGENHYITFEEDKIKFIYENEFKALKELVDKETPMKVKVWEHALPITRCPVCGRGVEKYGDDKYCPNCGQRLK